MKIDEAIVVLKQFKEESQKHKDNYTPIGTSNLSPILKIMQDTYQDNIDAFDMAIEALERARWIPVSERLPTEYDAKNNRGGFVLIHRSKSVWDVDFARWYNVTNDDLTSHWMPLPEPPQEV